MKKSNSYIPPSIHLVHVDAGLNFMQSGAMSRTTRDPLDGADAGNDFDDVFDE